MLIQEADVGLRAQRDVVLISPGLTAAVLLFLLRGSLAPSLQQLLELRFHQRPSEPSPTQSGASGPGAASGPWLLGDGPVPRGAELPCLSDQVASPSCAWGPRSRVDTSPRSPGVNIPLRNPHPRPHSSFDPGPSPAVADAVATARRARSPRRPHPLSRSGFLWQSPRRCEPAAETHKSSPEPSAFTEERHQRGSQPSSHLPFGFRLLHPSLHACAPRQKPRLISKAQSYVKSGRRCLATAAECRIAPRDKLPTEGLP